MRRLGPGWGVVFGTALVTAPVPYGGLEHGFVPALWLYLVSAICGAVAIVEGGSEPWVFLAIVLTQAVAWTAVLAALSWIGQRVLARALPAGQEPWGALLLVGGLLVVSLAPVYRSSLASPSGWTNLVGLVGAPAVGLATDAHGEAPPVPVVSKRERCAERDPLRRPFFGDLHVHTRLSLDASTQGTRAGPAEAYRFARGEPLGLQPYGPDGTPLRTARLTRPLDFAAVTDHAELFGEVRICTTPGLPGWASLTCRIFRRWPRIAFYLMNSRATSERFPERYGFCGPRDVYCLEAALTPWRETQQAAEAAYDRSSACRFTSFVGYEWTGAPDTRNLHRNVIFRSGVVPDLPISYYEAPNPTVLWRRLARHCQRGLAGCDVLVIPHNSNLSAGTMFDPPAGQRMTAAHAAAWAAAEPLIEIMQHKGDSECAPGLGGTDERCGFEKLPYDSFAGKFSPFLASAGSAPGVVREALKEGLVWQRRLGVNPFRFGFVASTDTHLGAAGAVDERSHLGHGGAGMSAAAFLPPGLPDDVEFNPGGLAVIWAEENTREALFDAMRRREVYGTSGPRIVVRLFGAWRFSENLCAEPDFAARGYETGVPMGGQLPPPPETAAAAPTFAIWALRDAGVDGASGTPLQRIQIVKGWLADDAAHERVWDVAGDGASRAGVDLASCRPSGDGYDSLCGTWTDPDFDPSRLAFYYVRVLENPSCRWTTWACNRAGVRCDEPDTIGEGFESCCDTDYPRTIQERAWTSPIWYVPTETAVPPG